MARSAASPLAEGCVRSPTSHVRFLSVKERAPYQLWRLFQRYEKTQKLLREENLTPDVIARMLQPTLANKSGRRVLLARHVREDHIDQLWGRHNLFHIARHLALGFSAEDRFKGFRVREKQWWLEKSGT